MFVINYRHLVPGGLFGSVVPAGEQATSRCAGTRAVWGVYLSCTRVAGRTATFVRPLHRPKHWALTGARSGAIKTRGRWRRTASSRG